MRPISDAGAINLTLHAAEFNPALADYEPAQSTGPMTISDAEGDPCNADLAAMLTRLGFERGYNRDWVRPDGANRDWNLSVGSYVEIYPDANAAHSKFDLDKTHDANPPTNCGVQIQSSSTFDVTPTVGEEAFGYRLTMTGEAGASDTYTWVEFRRGRIVACTDVIRGDSRDTAAETALYAELLDAHMVRSLSAPE